MKMLRLHSKIITISFLLLLSFVSSSQELNDSIQYILNTTPTDSAKVRLLLNMARETNPNERAKAIQIYKEALPFEKDKPNKGEILNTIGYNNWFIGNYNEALKYYEKALAIFEEIKDSAWIGRIYNNIAVVDWAMGKSVESLDAYQTALSFRKALNDKNGVARVLNNIGIVYQQWGLYDDAFQRHREALKIALNIPDDYIIAYSYLNIGSCFEKQNKLDSALQNYRIGYKYLLQWDNINRSNSFFSVNIGEVYIKMNKPDSALLYFHKALSFGKRIKNQNRIAIAYYNLGKTYFTANQLDSAKIYINRSYNMASGKNYTSTIGDNLFMLSKIAEQENNTTLAFDYYKKATAIKDSLLNTDKIARFTDLQIKYFTERQKQENLLLRKNNEIQKITIRQQRFLSIGLIVTSIFVLIILVNIASSKKSLKRLNTKLEKSEKELLSANADKDKFFAIIAHDLRSPFNGLIGITNLLSSDYDSFSKNEIKSMILAMKESTTNVYQLLEGLLEWSQIQTGKIKYHFEEFNLKKSGERIIELFSTNAKNKNISFEINIDKNIKVYADIKTTSAILRNLVSNAIKFTDTGGKIVLYAVEKNENIEISVNDTGIGMRKSTISKLFNIEEKISEKGTAMETGTGLGLILCKEFAEKNHGKIWVESVLGEGSTFTFTLPKSSTKAK